MTLLFLNSIGTGEFVLIIFVILMLFGSKGLPDFARNIGKGMREIKDASNEIRRDIQNSAVEMRRDLNIPSIDELTKTTEIKEIKEIEGLVKIDDNEINSSVTTDQNTSEDKAKPKPTSNSEGQIYSNKK